MTQIGYGPLERIDGPLPLAPKYGLLQAAEAPAAGVRIVVDLQNGSEDLNNLSSTGETMAEAIARLKAEGILPQIAGQERWLNGAEVYPYPPDTGDLFDTCAGDSGPEGTKTFGTDVEHPQFAAVTAYLAESCKSYKVWDQVQFRSRAAAAFAAVESSIIGRHLMTGEGLVQKNPHLADGNGVFPIGNTVTNPINALNLLVEQIALSGRQGLIHCSPMFANTIRERFVVDDKTGVIRDINGLVLIPDFGYTDAGGPNNHPAPTGTQEWIYATGPVDIRRTEVIVLPDNVKEALDRGISGTATTGRSNTITYRIERHYLVSWDTEVQAAVLVDRCQTAC